MRVTLYPRIALFVIALTVACGDPDEGDEPVDQTGNSAQSGDSGASDAAIALPQQDAGSVGPFDAGPIPQDAGATNPGSDAGNVAPTPDAGAADAATPSDGGARADASTDAGGDAGGSACSALTYESFGKPFITMYCARCHTGSTARRGIQLDTLAGVQRNKAAIKRVAVNATIMPEQDPKPNSADRQKLGQWLDCGPN